MWSKCTHTQVHTHTHTPHPTPHNTPHRQRNLIVYKKLNIYLITGGEGHSSLSNLRNLREIMTDLTT